MFKIFNEWLWILTINADHDLVALAECGYFSCSDVININYKTAKKIYIVLSFNFCGSLKSAKSFTLLRFWYMYSKVTSHSLTSFYIAMWQSLFSLKSAICIHSLFRIHVPECPVICKHRGCGFDESQTK